MDRQTNGWLDQQKTCGWTINIVTDTRTILWTMEGRSEDKSIDGLIDLVRWSNTVVFRQIIKKERLTFNTISGAGL